MRLEKRIILVGKAASGKDYFKKFLIQKGYIPSISHTTRPKRVGEIDGEDYFFISKTKFLDMVKSNMFYENKFFNGWHYGTSIEMFNTADVFIFTPSGVESLPRQELKNSLIVFFDIDPDIRIDRMNERSDADRTERRLMSDAIDFMDFNEYDLKVTNPNFDSEKILKIIISHISVC